MQRVKSTYCKKETHTVISDVSHAAEVKGKTLKYYKFSFLTDLNLQQLKSNDTDGWKHKTRGLQTQKRSCSECFSMGILKGPHPLMWLVVNQKKSSCQWRHTLRLICTSFIKTHILLFSTCIVDLIKKTKQNQHSLRSVLSLTLG